MSPSNFRMQHPGVTVYDTIVFVIEKTRNLKNTQPKNRNLKIGGNHCESMVQYLYALILELS